MCCVNGSRALGRRTCTSKAVREKRSAALNRTAEQNHERCSVHGVRTGRWDGWRAAPSVFLVPSPPLFVRLGASQIPVNLPRCRSLRGGNMKARLPASCRRQWGGSEFRSTNYSQQHSRCRGPPRVLGASGGEQH